MSDHTSSESASGSPGGSADNPPRRAGGSAFMSLTLGHVQGDLLALYQRIACEKGRIEILGGDGACSCVLISKAELDTLEEALDLLSNSDGVKAMRDTLAQFAAGIEPQMETA